MDLPCKCFEVFITGFNWFKTTDNFLMMPYVFNGEEKQRINFCPTCGKDVRDCKINKNKLYKLLQNGF